MWRGGNVFESRTPSTAPASTNTVIRRRCASASRRTPLTGLLSDAASAGGAAGTGESAPIVPPYSNLLPRKSLERGRSHANSNHRQLWLTKTGRAQAHAADTDLAPAIKCRAINAYERFRAS